MVSDFKTTSKNKKIDASNLRAIESAIKLGRNWQKTYPEIRDHYRNGDSLTKIEKILSLSEKHNISRSTAKEGVRFHLRGYHGELKFAKKEPYEGSIPLEEYEELSLQNRLNAVNAMNDLMKKEKRGTYSIPVEKRRELGENGAKTQIENKLGIHGQSYSFKKESAINLCAKMGFKLWSEDEKEILFQNMNKPEYKKGSKRKVTDLANLLNEKIHNYDSVRNGPSVAKFIKDEHQRRLNKLAPFVYTIIYLQK